jgi:phosphohistidine phosphatase
MSAPDSAAVRHLFLLRHATAGNGEPGSIDQERPLSPRGNSEAPRMAAHLAERAERLDGPLHIVCSSAVRARQTLGYIETALGTPPTVEVEAELYLASFDELLERVRSLDAQTPRVVVIGHNPGMADLAATLVDPTVPGAVRLGDDFPAAALAHLEFGPAGWSDVNAGRGRLLDFAVPKDLA